MTPEAFLKMGFRQFFAIYNTSHPPEEEKGFSGFNEEEKSFFEELDRKGL